MALVKCTKCGNTVSDQDRYCQHCGQPIHAQKTNGAYSFVKNPTPVYNNTHSTVNSQKNSSNQEGKPRCPICGSYNIDLSFVQTGAWTTARAPGTPTKAGRKAMKASTLGLWGLTGRRTGYSSTAFHNQKMAICKDCGHSWAFFTEREKAHSKTMLLVIGCLIAVFIAFLLFPSAFFDFNDTDTTSSKTALHSESTKKSVGIQDFEYKISDSSISLSKYTGNSEILEIQSKYAIDNIEYVTDLSDFQVSYNNVKTLIFNEGITDVHTSIFNGSNVQKIFFPKSISIMYDYTLEYLHPEKDMQIQIYYAGTEDDWNKIFTHYTTIQDTSSTAEAVGSASADFINGLIGSEYNASDFSYHFSAKIDDI